MVSEPPNKCYFLYLLRVPAICAQTAHSKTPGAVSLILILCLLHTTYSLIGDFPANTLKL